MVLRDVVMVLQQIQKKERENQNVHRKCGVRFLADNPEKGHENGYTKFAHLSPYRSQGSHDCSKPPSWLLSKGLESLWKSEITTEGSV